MRRIPTSLLPAAALALAAAPDFAEASTPDGGTYPSGGGVKTPATTYGPAPSYGAMPLMALEAPFAVVGGGMAATSPYPNCAVIRDFKGRYTSVCGP